MREFLPVPLPLVRRLWIGLSGGVLSLAITTVQGAYREGFDQWHQAISALSLGPGGSIQMVNLIVFGAFILSTVSPWRQILAGSRGATAYPLLTALVGLGFIGVGLIRQDPAPGYDPDGLMLKTPTKLGLAHLAIAAVAALSAVASMIVMGTRLAQNPAWPRWPTYSYLTAIIIIVSIAVYGVWSVEPTGFAGAFERIAVIAPMLWTFAFLRRLSRGAPLIASST